MSKQSSIEWLIEQLEAPCRGIPSRIKEQAKEMHKQEVAQAWYDGLENPTVYSFVYDRVKREAAEQYYNETYGKGEQQ